MHSLYIALLLVHFGAAQWGYPSMVYPPQMGQVPNTLSAPGSFSGQSAFNPWANRQQGVPIYPPGTDQMSQFGSQLNPMGMGNSMGFPNGQMGQMGQLGQMGQMGQMGSMGGNMGQGIGPGMGLGINPYGSYQGDSELNNVQNEVTPPALGPTRIIPPFLKGASQQEVDKFYEIVQQPSWSPSEKQKKIEEFVRGLNIDAQNLYSEFQRSSDSRTAAKRQNIHKVVNGMSHEAQIQFQKVSAVMTNPLLTNEQRLKKVQEIYKKIPDNIKEEIDSKLVDL